MSCASFCTAAQKSCAPGYIFEAALGVGAVCDRVNKRSETTNFYNLPKKSRTNHIIRTRWGRIETLFWQVGILGCERASEARCERCKSQQDTPARQGSRCQCPFPNSQV